jgi:hypothetical protein
MINKISNYIIDKKPDTPNIMMPYISFFEESYDDIRLGIIRNNRNISVDVLLDERPSSDLLFRSDENDIMATITPQIFSLHMGASRYFDISDIEKATFNLLNALTCAPSKLDINTKGMAYSDIKRMIQTTAGKCTASIVRDSRRCSTSTVLMGTEVGKYEIDKIFNCDVIVTDKIPHNKVIVVSVDNKCGMGINVVENPDKSLFYLQETQDYAKVIKWFIVQ